MKKLLLFIKLLALCIFAAGQTDLNTIDRDKIADTTIAIEDAFFGQVLPKGVTSQAVIDQSTTDNTVGIMVHLIVVTMDSKLVPMQSTYVLQAGDIAYRFNGILWAVQTSDGKFFLAKEEITSTTASVEDQKKEIYRLLDSATKANNDSLAKLNQQNVDLQKKNADLQKTVSANNSSGGPPHQSNNTNYKDDVVVVVPVNNLYSACFGASGGYSRNQPYPYRGYHPSRRNP